MAIWYLLDTKTTMHVSIEYTMNSSDWLFDWIFLLYIHILYIVQTIQMRHTYIRNDKVQHRYSSPSRAWNGTSWFSTGIQFQYFRHSINIKHDSFSTLWTVRFFQVWGFGSGLFDQLDPDPLSATLTYFSIENAILNNYIFYVLS